MLSRKGLIVAIEDHEVRGLLFSSVFGRTKVEMKRSASSMDDLLSAFPSDVPITLLLPGHVFMARTVTLPFTDPKIVGKTLPLELEGTLPLPVEELLIASLGATRTETGSTVFAVALPRKILADCMALFPEGRAPTRVIPDFVSLLSFARHLHDDGGTHGVLHVDGESMSLVIAAAGAPVMMRSTQTAGDWTSIAEWIDATIKSLAIGGYAVETLYVTGTAARQAAPLLESLSRVVPLPLAVNRIGASEWPAWAMLAGAALSASEYSEFNMLGSTAAADRLARTMRIVVVGTAAVLILGTADLYVRHSTASRTLATLKSESRRVFSAVMPQVRNVVKEDAQLRVALTTERHAREALLGAPSPSYVTVTRGLERLLVTHPDVKIREAAMEGSVVAITGDGRGVGSDALKRIFAGLEGAQDAHVAEMTQGVDPNTDRFRVKVQIR